jgi:hypothetical protein
MRFAKTLDDKHYVWATFIRCRVSQENDDTKIEMRLYSHPKKTKGRSITLGEVDWATCPKVIPAEMNRNTMKYLGLLVWQTHGKLELQSSNEPSTVSAKRKARQYVGDAKKKRKTRTEEKSKAKQDVESKSSFLENLNGYTDEELLSKQTLFESCTQPLEESELVIVGCIYQKEHPIHTEFPVDILQQAWEFGRRHRKNPRRCPAFLLQCDKDLDEELVKRESRRRRDLDRRSHQEAQVRLPNPVLVRSADRKAAIVRGCSLHRLESTDLSMLN